jgi:hypothetical protein
MFVLPLSFVPSSGTAGNITYGSNSGGITSSGGGPYTINGADGDSPQFVVKTQSTASLHGRSASGGGVATITLTRLETDECK